MVDGQRKSLAFKREVIVLIFTLIFSQKALDQKFVIVGHYYSIIVVIACYLLKSTLKFPTIHCIF